MLSPNDLASIIQLTMLAVEQTSDPDTSATFRKISECLLDYRDMRRREFEAVALLRDSIHNDDYHVKSAIVLLTEEPSHCRN